MNNFPRSQAEFLKNFNDTHREQFNDELFIRDSDDIIREVERVILSCQRNKSFLIQVDKFTVIENYTEIQDMLYEYEKIRTRSKDRKNKNPDTLPRYISLKDTDVKLLVVDYTLAIYNNSDPNKPSSKQVRVLIMIPRIVDKYYFNIYGNRYCAIYQILESTYNNTASNSKTDTVTLKTMFMASRIYRFNIQSSKDVKLINTRGERMNGIFYNSRIFDKSVQVMRYLLAKYGLYSFKTKIMVPDLTITDYDPDDDNLYTVDIHNLYISIPVFIYNNDYCAQSLFFTVASCIKKDTTLNDVFTRDFWLISLGESYGNSSVEKGTSLLESLESIYDEASKQHLKLPPEEKDDIYKVLIWLIREYSALRIKNNLDITMKRVRCAEYMGALYGTRMLRKIFNSSNKGSKITLTQLERIVTTFPDYLIRAIVKDTLVNYADNVNDNDSVLALKYSYKGVSGLGEQGTSIPDDYRRLHPSHIGRIDLDAATATDPGLTGMLCPMADIHNGQFSDESEPNTWKEECSAFLSEYRQLLGLKQAMIMQRDLGINNDSLASIQESIESANNIMPLIETVDTDKIETEMYQKAFSTIH